MINSVGQYEYVIGADVDEAHPHGDLDRIVIDGEVMPVRTGDTGKTDKDGNAISRQKILRGEDVAFLMEAVGQRYAVNWCDCVLAWYRGTNGELVWQEVPCARKLGRFSRKVCAENFANPMNMGRRPKSLYELFDDLCDKALANVNWLTPKVSADGNIIEDYGLTGGISESVRFFKGAPLPSRGGTLSTSDTLIKYYMTLAYLLCANLGNGYKSPLYGLGDISNCDEYISDVALVAIEGSDPMTSGDFSGWLGGWGVHMYKISKTKKSLYVICPKPDVTLLKVRAPHLAEVVAVFRVVCSWWDDVSEEQHVRIVWWPVTATKEGDLFTVTAADNFDAREKTEAILAVAGWTQPSFPEDSDSSWSRHATVDIQDVNLFGTWDDHTKWR